MTRLLRKILQSDAYEKVGIFSAAVLVATLLAVAYGELFRADQESAERWAKDGGTRYAAGESYGPR